jgi:hypothetical protein
MSLSNYEMEIVRRKSEQDPSIIDKLFSAKLPEAREYAKFLVRNSHELPDNLASYLGSDSDSYDTIVDISIAMKVRGLEIPALFMNVITSNATYCYDYAKSVLAEDPEAEIDEKIYERIMRDDGMAHAFVVGVMHENPQVELPEEMIALLKYNPEVSYDIVIKQLQNRIKKYEDLDKNLIEAIARSPKLSRQFAHFVQPYVDETPQEILKNIMDPETIRAKWHQGVTVKESFTTFFKVKTKNLV